MTQPNRTAREWLLARHGPATPSLDAIREHVIAAQVADQPQPTPVEVDSLGNLLGLIFRPHRRAWAVLGFVWLFLAVLHLTIARPPTRHSPSPQLNAAAIARHLAHLDPHETFARNGYLD